MTPHIMLVPLLLHAMKIVGYLSLVHLQAIKGGKSEVLEKEAYPSNTLICYTWDLRNKIKVVTLPGGGSRQSNQYLRGLTISFYPLLLFPAICTKLRTSGRVIRFGDAFLTNGEGKC